MGIHSTTDSMAGLFKLLVNDKELKTLMKIKTEDFNDFSELTTKYFQQTYVSDTVIEEPICTLRIRTAPQFETNNPGVRFDSVIIEIYVHNSIDTAGIGGFRRRTHQIADKLVKLLHNKYIGSDLYTLCDKNELQSGTPGFKRFYVAFRYKAVYA